MINITILKQICIPYISIQNTIKGDKTTLLKEIFLKNKNKKLRQSFQPKFYSTKKKIFNTIQSKTNKKASCSKSMLSVNYD